MRSPLGAATSRNIVFLGRDDDVGDPTLQDVQRVQDEELSARRSFGGNCHFENFARLHTEDAREHVDDDGRVDLVYVGLDNSELAPKVFDILIQAQTTSERGGDGPGVVSRPEHIEVLARQDPKVWDVRSAAVAHCPEIDGLPTDNDELRSPD